MKIQTKKKKKKRKTERRRKNEEGGKKKRKKLSDTFFTGEIYGGQQVEQGSDPFLRTLNICDIMKGAFTPNAFSKF